MDPQWTASSTKLSGKIKGQILALISSQVPQAPDVMNFSHNKNEYPIPKITCRYSVFIFYHEKNL